MESKEPQKTQNIERVNSYDNSGNQSPSDVFKGCIIDLPKLSTQTEIKNSEIIKQVSYYGQILTIPKSLSEAEIYVFKSIFDLYTKDNSVNNKSLDAFMKEYDQYQSLKLKLSGIES